MREFDPFIHQGLAKPKRKDGSCEILIPTPMDLEPRLHTHPIKRESWRTVLTLAFQSLGVVYGDLSISPLYVYRNTFAGDIELSESNEEIYGVLSFVFWTLTLVALVKYAFIVLRANDNGEGGTFALYSLLCRRTGIGFLPSGQIADEELSAYRKRDEGGGGGAVTPAAAWVKRMLERHEVLQRLLLILALIGASMIIGDGVLTPANSVFSAISGIEFSVAKEHHKYVEVPVACIILFCLFSLQHYGTHRVGFLFAPIIITWLLCISMIGVYNIVNWNPHVFQALSPHYMYKLLKKTKYKGWMSLGGTLLCITGSEAMFADLGHFSPLPIKIAFTCVVYPSLVLAYLGQAAYLSTHQFTDNYNQIGFYVSVPESIRWPVIAIAVLAAVVGSQAVITGTFSIIKQCSALGCFPKVKIVHTSCSIHGQIYIPEINWILMILCLSVTVGFRDTKHLGNASGLAVITGMLVTTCLMPLVIILCWRRSILAALCFLLFFGSIEMLYFLASLMKFHDGAWVPVVLSFIFMIVMYVWHYGTIKKYEFDVQNKVAVDWLLGLAPKLGIVRVRGIGLIHTELVTGIPAIFSHFVTNLPAFHEVLVFLCVKSVQVPYVKHEERILIGRVGPKEYRIYRCIVRYGYRELHKDDLEFEKDLVCSIAEFIRSEFEPNGAVEASENEDEKMKIVIPKVEFCVEDAGPSETKGELSQMMPTKRRVRFLVPESPKMDSASRAELMELMEARESGMAFILGHSYLKVKNGSGWLKKLALIIYDFLRRNCRSATYAVTIPQVSTLEVGMVYHV